MELPGEFASWIPWLGHPETVAPVALATARERGGIGFYPFADFSPELVAIRWAVARGVPVHAFDDPRERDGEPRGSGERRLMTHLLASSGAPDFETLWDRWVEAPAPGADAEAVRRAALGLGWALRADAKQHGVGAFDLHRESHMRACLAHARQRGARSAAVVGAFHAPALLARDEPRELPAPPSDAVTSLIPYAHDLLDSRSGYPAGIRDPMWQQRVFDALGSGEPEHVQNLAADVVTQVCRLVRGSGHVAGVPDGQEAVRMAYDLARLRALPAPGRRELLEGVESALGRGELLGRGVILGRALERVLVGGRRGRIAPGAPRSGLAPHVEGEVQRLRLPTPDNAGDDPKVLRLDVVRSELDGERAVFLQRLGICGVTYAELRQSVARETLTQVWTVAWTPATAATLALASTRGVTLEQASEGTLRAWEGRLVRTDEWTAAALLEALDRAARCALTGLTGEYLGRLRGEFVEEAGFTDLVSAIGLVGTIARGHVPGLSVDVDMDDLRGTLVGAAVRGLEGIVGSTDFSDAASLRELVDLYEAQPTAAQWADGRLGWALDHMADNGSALMVGAASAARVFLERDTVAALSERLGSWMDGARTPERRRDLGHLIHGVLAVAAPLFEASPLWARGVLERVEQTSDDRFLEVLPALRDGFSVLSPADRGRFLAALGQHLEDDVLAGRPLDVLLDQTPEELALWAAADRGGVHAAQELGLTLPVYAPKPGHPATTGSASSKAGTSGSAAPLGAQTNPTGAPPAAQTNPSGTAPAEVADAADPVAEGSAEGEARAGSGGPEAADPTLSAADRWRLILGRQREQLSPAAARYGRALDELYGGGRGEGAGDIGGQGGGKEAAFPSTRLWAEELGELFGTQVREEVLGRAAEGGRAQALAELDPDQVSASVDLLEQVLALRGSLPEGKLPQLRRLVARVVEQLVQELSTQLRPALSGLTTPTPTRRPGGPLDLRNTIRRNLARATVEDGEAQIIPTDLHFKTRARRSMDWRILLVVDVSGSMEPSVIYSALMAAILAGLPAVDVRFLAFNTEVIDLSERVSDPLSLLMEVEVGGGTHIARAIRFARGLVKVPQRTLLLVVSDFEEGFSVGGLLSEVRAVVDSGVTALGLASLDDRGAPRYSAAIAGLVAGAGMPVAALSPLELARWVGEQVRAR